MLQVLSQNINECSHILAQGCISGLVRGGSESSSRLDGLQIIFYAENN